MHLIHFAEGLALSKVQHKGAIILCFHEIDLHTFRRWLALLQQHFEIVSLDTLVDRHRSGESIARSMAITFDDGWKATCTEVARLSEQEKWPITIYVPTRVLHEHGSLWMAELPELLRHVQNRRVEAFGHVLDFTSPGEGSRTLNQLKAELIRSTGADALAMVRALSRAAGHESPVRESSQFIDEAFIKSYAGSSCVRFGSHGVDHQAFSAQSEAGIRSQLQESKSRLEALTGYPIRHLCYPYGDRDTIGPIAPTIVKQYYDSAVTMERGVMTSGSDLAYLPRIPLYEKDCRLRLLAKLALAK